MAGRVFGEISGQSPGSTFTDRDALARLGVHRPTQAGISGSEEEGADSIVVSGGYEDDEDFGDVIVYTGHGGNDPSTGKQAADQELKRGNLALAKSGIEGLPVRVVRGSAGNPAFSPPTGFRYDGLFLVEKYWSAIGKSGHRIWRYRLIQEPKGPPAAKPDVATVAKPAPRVEAVVQRLVRSTEVIQQVKALHKHCCQVCGIRLETSAGPYAEGAHIRPLGRPHDGPDTKENVLCLCPNDHVRFDYGGVVVTDDLRIQTPDGIEEGSLRTAPGHSIDITNLAYHRAWFSEQIRQKSQANIAT